MCKTTAVLTLEMKIHTLQIKIWHNKKQFAAINQVEMLGPYERDSMQDVVFVVF